MRAPRATRSPLLRSCTVALLLVVAVVAYAQFSLTPDDERRAKLPLRRAWALTRGNVPSVSDPLTMPAPKPQPSLPPPSPSPVAPSPTLSPSPSPVLAVSPAPPFPTDPAKPVIYLIQAEGIEPIPTMQGADILCITWKREIPKCDFLPESSWTQGRNHMWKKAVTMAKKYMYYIFMDEDITLNNLTLFEETLLAWQPPVAVPAGIAQLSDEAKLLGREAVILWRYDAAFDAFHYDVVHHSPLLPYGDLFDSFSWWLNQLFVSYMSQIFYPDQVLGFMKVTTWNHKHRAYPRGWNDSAIHQFFTEHIIYDPGMRKALKGAQWFTPGDAKVKPVGVQRYLLPKEMTALLDADTIWWNRIREIRNSTDGRPPKRRFGVAFTGEDFQKHFVAKVPK
eukprot:TRINITY_DN5362_c0_g1_i2.p1 TRINITY_DN5362_c0_g1~~TRINITY_DN5362_c0_g1_i2.p1  ORF type:complete len:406 (+),score=106.81 TRINITY_DN5362_c0_g1_i2:42-1220(+)